MPLSISTTRSSPAPCRPQSSPCSARAARGSFAPNRFRSRGAAAGSLSAAHEIVLNPDTFGGRSDADVLSTLVHEMVHHRQACFGKPGRGAYHNQEWAGAMRRVGLQPVNAANPDRETGDACPHTIVPDGPFDRAARAYLARGAVLHRQSSSAGGEPAVKSRAKTVYPCPLCAVKVWGKPALRLICGDCGERLQPDLD